MNEVTIRVKDQEVKLASTLRVAFNVQSKFGHKPYMEIFAGINDLGVDKQITILYEAYKVANRDEETKLSEVEFLNEILDNIGAVELTLLLSELVNSIMYANLTPEDVQRKKEKIQRMNKKMDLLEQELES